MASRAVTRVIEPGTFVVCEFCKDQVRFSAKNRSRQVIANVYEKGSWIRVEHYHLDCYQQLGQPYGQPAA